MVSVIGQPVGRQCAYYFTLEGVSGSMLARLGGQGARHSVWDPRNWKRGDKEQALMVISRISPPRNGFTVGDRLSSSIYPDRRQSAVSSKRGHCNGRREQQSASRRIAQTKVNLGKEPQTAQGQDAAQIERKENQTIYEMPICCSRPPRPDRVGAVETSNGIGHSYSLRGQEG
jgi:hypothetical protein